MAGTRLVSEWQGVEHTVTVTSDGFDWQCRPYKSLSAIARAITGPRQNRPLKGLLSRVPHATFGPKRTFDHGAINVLG